MAAGLLPNGQRLAGMDGEGLRKFQRGNGSIAGRAGFQRAPGEADGRVCAGQVEAQFLEFERAGDAVDTKYVGAARETPEAGGGDPGGVEIAGDARQDGQGLGGEIGFETSGGQ